MLRLRLIECLRSLSLDVEQLQRGSEEADHWANRVTSASRRSSERLLQMMEELVRRHAAPSAHFARELAAHLYDEEAALPIVTQWLERLFPAPLLDVMQQTAIARDEGRRAQDYLDKIVQVRLDMPAAQSAQASRLLDDGLQSALQGVGVERNRILLGEGQHARVQLADRASFGELGGLLDPVLELVMPDPDIAGSPRGMYDERRDDELDDRLHGQRTW